MLGKKHVPIALADQGLAPENGGSFEHACEEAAALARDSDIVAPVMIRAAGLVDPGEFGNLIRWGLRRFTRFEARDEDVRVSCAREGLRSEHRRPFETSDTDEIARCIHNSIHADVVSGAAALRDPPDLPPGAESGEKGIGTAEADKGSPSEINGTVEGASERVALRQVFQVHGIGGIVAAASDAPGPCKNPRPSLHLDNENILSARAGQGIIVELDRFLEHPCDEPLTPFVKGDVISRVEAGSPGPVRVPNTPVPTVTDDEYIGASRTGQGLIAEGCHILEIAGYIRFGSIHYKLVGPVVTRSPSLYGPFMISVAADISQEHVRTAGRGQTGDAEAHRLLERTAEVAVAEVVQTDAVSAVRTRAAELMDSLKVAVGVVTRDKGIAHAGTGEYLAVEDGCALENARDVDFAGRRERDAVSGVRSGTACPIGPEYGSGRVHLGHKDIAAARARECGLSELDRTLECTGNIIVVRVVGDDAISHVFAGRTVPFCPGQCQCFDGNGIGCLVCRACDEDVRLTGTLERVAVIGHVAIQV